MKFLAVVLAVVIHASPVAAESACGSRDSILSQLNKEYGEARRGFGWSSGTEVFEIWTSSKPPYTWTMLKIFSNGNACVMATGQGWTWVPVGDPV